MPHGPEILNNVRNRELRCSILEPSKPDIGIYYELLEQISAPGPSLSFLAGDRADADSWREGARKKVLELMDFSPRDVPLNPTVESSNERDGVLVEEIAYDMPYGPRTHGYFLCPTGGPKRKLPAVVALHDHGGFFYYGKEKIVETSVQSPLLQDFKVRHYGGRNWATELAKRGFAVLAVDVFLWGSRKISMESVNPSFLVPFQGLESGSDRYIQTYNDFWDASESPITASSILNAGASWPGVFAYEDRRSVDYLLTRTEVDPDRIGCGGLSGGGIRSVFLAGLDPRIKAGFCVGFMSTIGGMLRNHIRGNGLIMYVPQLPRLLDLPDVIALRAPSPLLVQYLEGDGLFSLDGQHSADRKIAEIYSKMGHPNNYTGRFYPGPHRFTAAMQDDAFDWLKASLA
jgi:dienelactone hydrolase